VDSFEQLVEDLTGCDIGNTFNLFRDEVSELDVDGGAARKARESASLPQRSLER
jgi:hypothetical protein